MKTLAVPSGDDHTRWSIKKSEECGRIHPISCTISLSTSAVAKVENASKNKLKGNGAIALKLSNVMLGSPN